MASRILCTIFLACFLLEAAWSAKILLLPAWPNSHVLYFNILGDELIKNKHDVSMVLSPRIKRPMELSKNIKTIHYTASEPEYHDLQNSEELEMNWLKDVIANPDSHDFVRDTRKFDEAWATLCTNPLSDQQLYKNLLSQKFDFALIDGFLSNRCMYVLLYKLGIPYGTFMTMYEPWLSRTPALPSFVPFQLTTSYTEKMTFWQRVYNIYRMVDLYAWPRITALDDNLVTKYAPDKPFKTLNYLAGQSHIWLQNTDVALDYPLPTMPNMIFCGGVTTKEAKPLAGKIATFVQGAKSGVVLVSFGSHLRNLPQELVDRLLAAFKLIDQKVIWKLPKPEIVKKVPSNVLIEKWVPQNDILGHSNTKLFISHCGNNGQFEALYHSVPMICLPIFGDQPYNSARMEYKGYGIKMAPGFFKARDLAANIRKAITDETYKNNIKEGSEIFKSADMPPLERAVYWIEHILEFGGDHLHSYALEMPWWAYMMLDILALFMTVLTLILFTVCKISKLVFRLFRPAQKVKTQ